MKPFASTVLIVVPMLLACSPDPATVAYAPHVVLELDTDIDMDGAPDIADPHVIKVDGAWFLYATQTKR